MDDKIPTSADRVRYISEACKKIMDYCENITEQEFIEDDMLNSAVLYQFIIIGEAIRHVDLDVLKKYPYQWHLPRSFRNYAAHDYFGINLSQVYNTVKELLPDFKILIDTILKENYKY
jgi:uncharacterized protein with HEPN domain